MRRTTLDFDELHRLGRAIPYKEFFGKMYISPTQMNTRIALAEEIEDVMLFVFAYWIIAGEAEISEAELKQDAKEKLKSVIARHTKLDPYLERHIEKVIDEVIKSTKDHSNEDGDYWTSPERAMLIAENEANSFENYVEYREAKTSGKTKKIWQTELDDKVRITHELAEGQTVDIDGLFFIGGSKMRFPMDTMYDPAPNEVINCRCACKYE